MPKKKVTVSIDEDVYKLYKKRKAEDPDYTLTDAILEYYGKSKKKDEEIEEKLSGKVHPYEEITAKALAKKLLEDDKKKEIKLPPMPPPAPKKQAPPAPPVIVLGKGDKAITKPIDTEYNLIMKEILERLERLEEKETKEKFMDEIEQISDEYMKVFEEVQKAQGEINQKIINSLEKLNARLEKLEKRIEEEENIDAGDLVKTLTETGTLKDIVKIADKFLARSQARDALGTLVILGDLIPKWKQSGLTTDEIAKILRAYAGGGEGERGEEEY